LAKGEALVDEAAEETKEINMKKQNKNKTKTN